MYSTWWRSPLLCSGLRQISAVLYEVLRETWRRKEMCTRGMREGGSRAHAVLRCSWRWCALQARRMQPRCHWKDAALSRTWRGSKDEERSTAPTTATSTASALHAPTFWHVYGRRRDGRVSRSFGDHIIGAERKNQISLGRLEIYHLASSTPGVVGN